MTGSKIKSSSLGEGTMYFSSPKNYQTGSGTQPGSYFIDNVGGSPESKRAFVYGWPLALIQHQG